jgi:hypothetical protein
VYLLILAAQAAIAGLYGLIVQPEWSAIEPYRHMVFLLAVTVPLILSTIRIPWVIALRARDYPSLWSEAESSADEANSRMARDDLLRRLLEVHTRTQVMPIVGLLKDGPSLRLILDHVPGIEIGSELVCIQLSSGNPVGQFNVSSVNGDRCIASEVVIHDALWWGAIRERVSQGRIGRLDDTAAFVLTGAQGGANDRG